MVPERLQDTTEPKAADLFDSQFSELADDPRVPETGRLGDLDDQFANLAGFPLSPFGIRLPLSALVITNPAVERARRHDRNQFFDGSSQGFAELQQPLALLRSRVNLALDSLPKNLVLFFQELDILRQFAVSAGSNEREQGVKKTGHGGIVLSPYCGTSCTLVVPRFNAG